MAGGASASDGTAILQRCAVAAVLTNSDAKSKIDHGERDSRENRERVVGQASPMVLLVRGSTFQSEAQMAILNVAGQTIDTNHLSGQLADVRLPYIPDFLQSFLRNAILKKIIVAVGPGLLALMVDAADGLTDDEIDKHAKNLTQIVSDSTHLPEMLVEPLVRALLSYATKGKSLTLTAGA